MSIWRSCRWEKEYFDTSTNNLADVNSFQECFYSWEPFGDPFGSIINIEKTQRLREVLMEKFSLEQPPDQRRIENLQDVLQVMDEILAIEDDSSWSDSEDIRPLSKSENVNLRQHQLLALRQHIQWVYDTFIHVPDINVSFK